MFMLDAATDCFVILWLSLTLTQCKLYVGPVDTVSLEPLSDAHYARYAVSVSLIA